MKNSIALKLFKPYSNQSSKSLKLNKFKENWNEKEVLMDELKEVYWYEKELLVAIPMLISNATTFELVEMLTIHIIYTRNHIEKLEKKIPSIIKLNQSIIK
jgi:ferritin-like metal-binding protein YciE